MHALKQICMPAVLVFHEGYASLDCALDACCVKAKPLFTFCIFYFHYSIYYLYCILSSPFSDCHACVWLERLVGFWT